MKCNNCSYEFNFRERVLLASINLIAKSKCAGCNEKLTMALKNPVVFLITGAVWGGLSGYFINSQIDGQVYRLIVMLGGVFGVFFLCNIFMGRVYVQKIHHKK